MDDSQKENPVKKDTFSKETEEEPVSVKTATSDTVHSDEVENLPSPNRQQPGIKRTFLVNKDTSPIYAQDAPKDGKSKIMLLIIIILVLGAIAAGGYFLRNQAKSLLLGQKTNPTPSPTSESSPSPSPSPLLIRSDWTFEVLNGTATAGLAKKVASGLQELGYPVVKSGNADKGNYNQTQILVKKDLLEKIDLVIVDLKDVILIATIAGELDEDEGTASARIIIGKDSI